MILQVHRFHDNVALYARSNEQKAIMSTLYLTPFQAAELGRQLIRYAEDCRSCRFSASNIGTFHYSSDED